MTAQFQSFAQTQRQSLEQRLSPQMLQSIKMMELPLMELRERIDEELDRNPALEVEQDESIVSLDHALNEHSAGEKRESDAYFETSSDPGWIHGGGEEAAEKRRQFIEGALSQPETLQQHLLGGLALEPVDDKVRAVAETIIGNLDEDGFHITPPEILLKNILDREGGSELVVKALNVVRSLDPPGCAAADYRESLKIQASLLRDRDKAKQLSRALNYLELLEKGRYEEAGEKLGIDEDAVKTLVEELKMLSPFPGRQFASASSEGNMRYIKPDIEVRRNTEDAQDEGGPEFSIILNDEEIPVLGLNPFFLKIADEKGRLPTDKARTTRDFARDNVKEARWFIQAINDRNQTLLRVTRAIVYFQKDFFKQGPRFLRPLTLATVAAELELAESTVSRTAASKYVQTEWGLYSLRYFFSNSISGKGAGGSSYSKTGVKELLKEIINTAQKEKKKLSDQAIANELEKKGVKLARRTVAKYRKEIEENT